MSIHYGWIYLINFVGFISKLGVQLGRPTQIIVCYFMLFLLFGFRITTCKQASLKKNYNRLYVMMHVNMYIQFTLTTQCGNCRNSLSHYFRKNSVKTMVLLYKEMTKYVVDLTNFLFRWVIMSRFSTVLCTRTNFWSQQKISWNQHQLHISLAYIHFPNQGIVWDKMN